MDTLFFLLSCRQLRIVRVENFAVNSPGDWKIRSCFSDSTEISFYLLTEQ